MSITIKDFQPINHWSLDRNGDLSDSGEPLDLIDETTERKYRNESTQIIRFKCALLAITVPIVHAAAACLSIAWKIMKLPACRTAWGPFSACLAASKETAARGQVEKQCVS